MHVWFFNFNKKNKTVAERGLYRVCGVFVFLIITFLGTQISTVYAETGWYNDAWGYRTKITIDHTKVASSTGTLLTNFPVLVSTTTTALKYTSFSGGHVGTSTGADILFTSADGTTALNYEIEKYASSTGELVSWVKIPSLATTTDTDIYMYYGNASASTPATSVATGVWDDGGSNYFKGVWHLSDAGNSTSTDSTSNGNNGTNNGVTATSSGQIAGAAFANDGDYIDTGINSILGASSFTLSAWINTATVSKYSGAISIGDSSPNQSAYIGTVQGAQVGTSNSIGGGFYGRNYGSGVTTLGSWSHVVLTYNSSNSSVLYVNGVIKVSETYNSANLKNNYRRIGRIASNNGYDFLGLVDESRISSVARSADWIKTEYNNQSSPGTFAISATEEAATVPDAPTGLTPTAGNTQIGLLWTAPGNTGGLALTDYVIDYKLNSTSTWSTYADGVSTTTTFTIIGLVNGTSYDFRVSAVNALGQGSASATVTATPATIPGAPTIGTATAGNAQASVSFTLLPSPSVAPWYNNSWTYRKKITIDKTKVPNTNQTNFPVLVSLAGLSNINANGTDIRFTDSTGTTELAREIESYSAGTLVAWVKVPTLSTSANTDIYMYYGNSSQTSEPSPSSTYGSQKVWDDGGSNYFKGVWHLANAGASTSTDSTGVNNGTNNGVTATSSGQIAGAGSFNGTGNYVKISNFGNVAPVSEITIGIWLKMNKTSQQAALILNPDNFNNRMNFHPCYSNGNTYWDFGNAAVNGRLSKSNPSNCADNNWHYYTLTSSSINNSMNIYLDGVLWTNKSGASNFSGTTSDLNIGGIASYYFNGSIDEVKISNTARSADWIKTEYNNQSSPGTFYAVAGVENVANSATNGGSAITAYTVTSSPGGFTSASTTSPIIVTGLTNGTPYTFTVTATNVMGTGPASSASNSVTPATVPGAPTAVTPTAGDRQVSVLWSAPASNGGSAITDYIIEYKLTSASDIPASWQIYSDPETPVITATVISGLINGTSYDFRITARNAVGSGSPSSPLVNSTPKTIPGKPVITSAVSGDRQVTVNFTPLPYPTVSSAGVWYNQAWLYRKKITIDKTKVPNTNQTNFPVLVSLTGLSNINANGTDIRFTDSNGTTELAREIESYSAGTLVAWVKVPVLSTSANTDIYMYYGNSSATSEPSPSSAYGSQKVWDDGGSSYFKGVWHLADPTNSVDSTGVNNGTNHGVTATSSGKINGAGSFNGSSKYIDIGDAEVVTGTALTFGSWVSPHDVTASNRDTIVGKNGYSTSGGYTLQTSGTSIVYDVDDTVLNGITVAGQLTQDVLAYFVVTYDGTNARLYKNGLLVDTTPRSGSLPDHTHKLEIGVQDVATFERYFDGIIDEVRITNTVRTADWIKTEYNNQSSPATFYAVAGEENVSNSATNGGSEIINYTVTSDPESIVSSSSTSPVIVTGLTNGTPYTFTMTATNVVGTSETSVSSSPVTPAGVPGIPSGLTATPGNASADLSWTAPANNGAEISNYVIEYKLHTAESWTQFGHPASPAITITVVDLVNGSLYDFRVSAYNSAGTGAPSDPPVSSTPRTVPGQPVITSVLRGNGQVTVGFTAPISDGGSIITGYTVTSDPQAIIQTGSASPIIISGLTNGTEYTFTVKATNVAGDGPVSTSSNPVTPATVPGKATGVTAVAGNAQATVTFSAPLSTGGSAITGYTVYSNNGGTDSNASSTGLSHIMTGLTNGGTYTFTVIAVNDVGDGLASDPSSAITLPTAPSAPLNLAAVVKGSRIDLTWSDPASTGGSAITDYVIEYELTTGGSWVAFDDGESVDKFANVIGLSNGTSYDFRVSAKNIIGTSTVSDSVSATPGEPAQVFIQGFPDLTNSSIGTNIRITNEGLVEYEYQYTWCVTDAVDNLCGGGNDVFGASNAKLIDSHENYDFTATSTVLTPGEYYFHISVLYGSQSSYAFSSFTAVATFPDPPTGVSAVAGNAEATISFTAPASNGGTAITNYTVTSSPGGLTGTGLTTPIVVTGLTNGTAYTFTMTATNIIGTGLSSSPPSNSVTPVSVPDVPSGVTAVAGNTSVVLSWLAPADDGGLDITDYVIEYKLTSEPAVWTIFADGVSVVTTVTITGLTNNVSYDFRISAVNALGRSGVNNTSATLPVTRVSNTTGSRGYQPVLVPVSPVVNIPLAPAPVLITVPRTDVISPTKNIETPAKVIPGTGETVEPNPIKNKNEVTIIPSENPPAPSAPFVVIENSGLGKWWYVIDFTGLLFLGWFVFFIWRRLRGEIY
jgi:titin